MRTHSLFSPSRLAMLKKCPAWTGKLALSTEAMPSNAQRGIDLHEAITSAFMQGLQSHDDSVIDYSLKSLQDIKQGFPYAAWQAEVMLDTGIPNTGGYADLIGLDTFDNTAILIELKSGYGDRPEAEGNIQLKAYGMALLRQVEIVRCYLIEADQKKTTTAIWRRADMPAIHNEIIGIINQALQGGQYQAGPHCEYCNKTIVCPALEDAVISIKTAEAAINEAKTLTPAEVSEKLSAYWQRMELAERYWANLKARAISIIEAGGDIEGFSVKVSSGIRKWTDEQKAIDSLSNAEVNTASIMTLQSPAQVEKTLKASGMKAAEVKALLSGLTVAGERRQLIASGENLTGPSRGAIQYGQQSLQESATI